MSGATALNSLTKIKSYLETVVPTMNNKHQIYVVSVSFMNNYIRVPFCLVHGAHDLC